MEIKTTSAAGIEFLIKEEGLKTKPYLDSVSIPTIGCGCTYYENGKRVTMQDAPITRDRAIDLFKNLLKHYELAVYSVTRDDINQNQFDALVSLCYNIGITAFKASTVLKRVNSNPNALNVSAGFERWQYAGGKPVLFARRKREIALYFQK